jgi:hypothetical protein
LTKTADAAPLSQAAARMCGNMRWPSGVRITFLTQC